ncbi:hybrid sensor histidine kinase/response regulator [Aureimonas sp. N4]|uniref:hybrid sensor histidine kinase/response regulator n=1 Tax=Aureimonas sp. N4 TaxID=1638165 RepID=UPI000782D029|nr:ATP-binding protein [Aureimonas sp. N4]
MTGRQRILPVRRDYNRWVANQTLEDYALRFTAKRARRWSAPQVSQTAIGAISFLALEAVGGAITLSFGFSNAALAILVVGFLLLVTGLPISLYAARYGVDIDLLTRGAGFGYIGSTVTSLIYATFTFILFAVEASIMTAALELAFGLPLWLGYIISAVAVVPLVTHGVTWISRFQLATQPLWIGLNILPVGFILWHDWGSVEAWLHFPGLNVGDGNGLSLVKFGAAASVILALMPQIGEQVDILRFLPKPKTTSWRDPATRSWWLALLSAGPGWIVLGAPKLLFGSFLAVLALRAGVSAEHAAEPAHMYDVAFGYVLPSPVAAAFLTAAFVVVSQLKINVMNAYAGSLAWSNFFSRLTHSHPGRVVWLVFNVAIALLLMELGIYEALEVTFGLFANVAVAWLGAIVADLAINKPLGLSPKGIEFKRAHLYDLNPVGLGSMGLATLVSLLAFGGVFGETAQALSAFVALGVALVTAPIIAFATGGRFYLARKPRAEWQTRTEITCSICEHPFEPEDMAYCPAYAAPICSLCCSLDARCHDLCKPKARFSAQMASAGKAALPERLRRRIDAKVGHYIGGLALLAGVISVVLSLIYYQAILASPDDTDVIAKALWAAFFVLMIVAGVSTWFFVLAQESRRVAQEESARQTQLLLKEIEAHRRTDAALQKAKEMAEAASLAKSRYVVGMSHELRTPLNAVLGYAQLLEQDTAIPQAKLGGIKTIRRSAEHLSGLIDGLLDISKIETGRLQLQRGEVRLGDFLAQLVDMFRLQASAKGLEFRFTRPETLPEVVRTDEKRLRQILINLLSNAVKYTEAGSVGFDVAYRSQVAIITVSDTGPGIPPLELERIFEPFERGSAAQGKAPGLGLGLTITRLLANLMGGDIKVSSAPGKGSRFEVRVMLSAVAATREATVPVSADPGAPLAIEGYAGSRRTVLVVDDDETHRDLMVEVLRPLGFIVLTAPDGPAALAVTAEMRPDLFLLDVQMPGMNGWELATALRASGQTGRMVMLSATFAEAPRAGESGSDAAAQLPKPFDLRQLLATVRDVLGLEWTGATAKPAAEPVTQPLRFPPPADIAELLRFCRIGYARGIEQKLAALDDDPQYRPFSQAMRVHLNGFDLKRLAEALETARDD